ncbi:MAG: hypothetical protein H5T86_02405, partial [Armatimonadetes bacterium]|nr:hypothetical protein [Armatimonadota bacterium]
MNAPVLAVACIFACATQQNLLPNGNFERGGTETLAADWEFTGAGAVLDRSEKHLGNCSLRLHAASPEAGVLRVLSRPIPVSGTIRVTAWLKTEGVLAGRNPWDVAAVRVYIYDSAGKPVAKHWGHFDVAGQQGTQDWRKYETTITLYPEVTTIRVA